jgi:hypothetical protein
MNGEGAEVSAADLGGSTAMKDLAQQRTIRQLEAINLNVLAAQADIKRVADELSALTARVDTLEDVTSSIARQPNARAPAVTGSSKKPSQTPKSTARNSVAVPWGWTKLRTLARANSRSIAEKPIDERVVSDRRDRQIDRERDHELR